MTWTNTATSADSVSERDFRLQVDGHDVPGVYWAPEDQSADRLVLLGHGGTTHKRVEYIVEVAKLLCARGIAAAAIDGPGHGDRRTEPWPKDPSAFKDAWREGGGTQTVLTDWRATLDFLEAEHGPRPTGWWGLSMGTMMGLPVTANEPRIKVAQLGLMGTWGPNAEELKAMAAGVQCPVRFLVQWDDEIVPRDTCLELFGLLGTSRKTLHANPGLHSAVPSFEIAGSVDYLDRYLR